MLEAYLKLLELGYYEGTFAFKGLKDENVWKRPTDGLLSVGELAGHTAYWLAVRLAGGGADIEGHTGSDVEACRVHSPLIDHRFRYCSDTIATRPSEQHLALTAAEVGQELQRVHKEVVADLVAQNPDLASCPPGLAAHWTYAAILEYSIFHVGYHVGQMYTVRHLLGEETPDN